MAFSGLAALALIATLCSGCDSSTDADPHPQAVARGPEASVYDFSSQLPPQGVNCREFMDWFRGGGPVTEQWEAYGFLTMLDADGKDLAYVDFNPVHVEPGPYWDLTPNIAITVAGIDDPAEARERFDSAVEQIELRLEPVFSRMDEPGANRFYVPGYLIEREGRLSTWSHDWGAGERFLSIRPEDSVRCTEFY